MSLQLLQSALEAMLIAPGAVLTVLFGALIEALTRVARRRTRWGLPPLRSWSGFAIVYGLVAAAQLSMPLSPLSPTDTNLAVAAMALVLSGWLGWLPSGLIAGARRLLIFQALWLVAVMAPGVFAQSLRPQTVAVLLVGPEQGIKLAAGVLYLICLPFLLGLVGEGAVLPVSARLFLWFPYCGLFVSELLVPAGGGLAGAARFVGLSLLVAALTLALAAGAGLIGAVRRRDSRPAGGRVQTGDRL